MRKIVSLVCFAVLMGCAAPARTQVFVMPNQGGGEITLTARPCVIRNETIKGLAEAYTWSPSTAYQKACWSIIDGSVHVLYLDSGKRMVYDITDFREKR